MKYWLKNITDDSYEYPIFEVELELQTTDSYNYGLEDGYRGCLLEILKNINVENKE